VALYPSVRHPKKTRCPAPVIGRTLRPAAAITQEISMSDSTPSSTRTIEDRLKLAGLALGVASTGLGLYVAAKTQFIDSAVTATQATAADIQKKLVAQEAQIKDLSLASMKYEGAVRLRLQWEVMPAHEFAKQLQSRDTKLAWTDAVLQRQLMDASTAWLKRNELMGRDLDRALLLRQIVCLRIINASKTAVSGLRLHAHIRDYATASAGVSDKPFGELKAGFQGAGAAGEDLGSLLESGQDPQNLANDIIIPVAQVVGVQRYVGRLVLPTRLVWKNERTAQQEGFDINLASVALQAKLEAAWLGRSKDENAGKP
jgi:hypothetical protein